MGHVLERFADAALVYAVCWAFAAVLLAILALYIIAMQDFETPTRSGPFWRPADYERRHGGLGGAAND